MTERSKSRNVTPRTTDVVGKSTVEGLAERRRLGLVSVANAKSGVQDKTISFISAMTMRSNQ
jgi:hypothetical protein